MPKRLLITGATGTLGGALVERFAGRYAILAQGRDARRLAELAGRYADVTPIRGDLRCPALHEAIAHSHCIVHAAAQKYADRAEQDCSATVDTNVVCTAELAWQAARAGAERFIFIGSDKGTNCNNVYGASKFLAERIVREVAAAHPMQAFVVCRLGNIFGSRGSVARLWLDASRSPDPVIRVTDPRMTRFMGTVEQAAAAVGFALEAGRNGDIIIPKLRAVLLEDLLALFDGARVEVTGARPGERSHELLHVGGDEERGYETDDYYVINRIAPQAIHVPVLDSSRAARVGRHELRQWLDASRRQAG